MNNIPGLISNEDGFGYGGEIILPAWKGFQSRNGPYCSIDSPKPSNGKCQIFVIPEYEEEDWAVQEYHIKAYDYLIENQDEIKQRMLNALINEYSKLQEMYAYEPEEKEEYMPDVKDTDDFKKILGLSIVHLIDVEKDGYCYVGFELGCNWDDEHGVGIMTYKDRIVKIGGGDTAFLTWIAEQDKKLGAPT